MLRVDSEELEPSESGDQLLWRGTPFTGVATDSWPDGTPYSEAEYVDGVLNGSSKEWFRSGQPRLEERLKNGALHGVLREWREPHQLVREAEYEYGIKLRERTWDESGALLDDFVLREDDPNAAILAVFRRAHQGKAQGNEA